MRPSLHPIWTTSTPGQLRRPPCSQSILSLCSHLLKTKMASCYNLQKARPPSLLPCHLLLPCCGPAGLDSLHGSPAPDLHLPQDLCTALESPSSRASHNRHQHGCPFSERRPQGPQVGPPLSQSPVRVTSPQLLRSPRSTLCDDSSPGLGALGVGRAAPLLAATLGSTGWKEAGRGRGALPTTGAADPQTELGPLSAPQPGSCRPRGAQVTPVPCQSGLVPLSAWGH